MDRKSFESWLEAYGRAWESRDPQASARLFTDDAPYYETPFEEPARGREGITEHWAEAQARSGAFVSQARCSLSRKVKELRIGKWLSSGTRRTHVRN